MQHPGAMGYQGRSPWLVRLSVRGPGGLPLRSSGVFRCRSTRIPATMGSTRFRPSPSYSPFVRFSLAAHFDLKTSHSDRESQVKVRVGRNEVEAVGGNGDDARLQIGPGWVRRRFSFLGARARARTNIVRRMCHISDKFRSAKHICKIYATLF
jgi:hypothetical protein